MPVLIEVVYGCAICGRRCVGKTTREAKKKAKECETQGECPPQYPAGTLFHRTTKVALHGEFNQGMLTGKTYSLESSRTGYVSGTLGSGRHIAEYLLTGPALGRTTRSWELSERELTRALKNGYLTTPAPVTL